MAAELGLLPNQSHALSIGPAPSRSQAGCWLLAFRSACGQLFVSRARSPGCLTAARCRFVFPFCARSIRTTQRLI